MTSVPKAQHNLEPKVSKLSKSLLFGYGMKKKVERAFTSLRRGGNCEETSSHSLLSSRESIAAWHRKNVNVYDFYEVIDVIGHGQMGEVSMVKRKPKAWDKVMKRANHLSSVPLDDLEDRLSVSLHNKTLSLRDELGSSDADISNTRKLSVTLHNNYKLPSSMNAEGTSSVKSHSYNTLLGGSSGSRKKPISREEEYRDSFLRHYACKTVSTTRIKAQDLEVFLNEVSIMRKLDHPNIVQLYEIYSTRHKMWLITELCYGGDLFSRKLDEMEVAVVMEQILQAVAHMHSLGVCHGDLKLENVLYESLEPDSVIKLIDFGLSQKFFAGEQMKKVCGTIYTVSPEIIECDLQISEGFTEKSDIWSIGCIAFILLSGGDYPFLREPGDVYDEKKLSKLLLGNYEFSHRWDERKISHHAKEFISGTLQKDPKKRWSAIEALTFVKETWFSGFDEIKSPIIAKRRQLVKMPSEVLRGMQSYALYGPLRKAILNATARNMDKSTLTDVQDLFLSMDHHHTGSIRIEDFKRTFLNFYESSIESMLSIEQIFFAIDTDRSGDVNYTEFVAAVAESQGLITLERLQDTFRRFDMNGKGYISKGDLRQIFGKDADEGVISKMIEEATSRTNEQRISYDEFLHLMLEEPDGLKTSTKLP